MPHLRLVPKEGPAFELDNAPDGNRAFEPDGYEPLTCWPWALRIAIALGLVVWIFAFIGARAVFGQIQPTITVTNSRATSIIRNPSPESMNVTVALHFGTSATLDSAVKALVSPSSFTLGAGETQTLRLKLQQPVAPGTVLRILTCFTPTSADQPLPGSDTAPVARLVLRTCINGKVRVT
jgi:P pilus assembly chaperone PapD